MEIKTTDIRNYLDKKYPQLCTGVDHNWADGIPRKAFSIAELENLIYMFCHTKRNGVTIGFVDK